MPASLGNFSFALLLLFVFGSFGAQVDNDAPADVPRQIDQLAGSKLLVANFQPVRVENPAGSWAAAALTVANSMATAPGNADLCGLYAAAAHRLTTECCGPTAMPDGCEPISRRSALTGALRNQLGLTNALHRAQPLSSAELLAELQNGHAVIAGFGWPEAPRKFMVIYGFRTRADQTNFYVFDPTAGFGEVDYPTLLGDTGLHNFWSDSWYNLTSATAR